MELYKLCKNRNIEEAVRHIEMGGSINDQIAPFMQTASHLAAGFGLAEVIEALALRMDWKPDLHDSMGRSPFDCAVAQGHHQLAKFINSTVEERKTNPRPSGP